MSQVENNDRGLVTHHLERYIVLSGFADSFIKKLHEYIDFYFRDLSANERIHIRQMKYGYNDVYTKITVSFDVYVSLPQYSLYYNQVSKDLALIS